MAVFFGGPGDFFDGLKTVTQRFDYDILDDQAPAQSLIPTGNVKVDECVICFTDLEQAPFLITTRSKADVVMNAKTDHVVFVTRRIAMLQEDEAEICNWVSAFSGVEPTRREEVDGNISWVWALPKSPEIVQDNYRLYVAKTEKMLVLDRMATAPDQEKIQSNAH